MKSILLAWSLLFSSQLNQAQSNLVLVTPEISPDGNTIAFSFQGDIWTVSANGGKAVRLTIHPAYESMPRFSPDGKTIAFTSNRYGNNDVFLIPVGGGVPNQLTYRSSDDVFSSWKGNDELVFSTSRDFKQIERNAEVYTVSVKGGTPQRTLDAFGYDPIYSPNGRFLAFVKGDINPLVRKDYSGSSNREIWTYDTKNKNFTKLNLFSTNDAYPHWVNDNTLFFMSSEAGNYNIYSVGIDGNGKQAGDPSKITSLKAEEQIMRSFSMSYDGKALVFEQGDGLFLMTEKNGTYSAPKKVTIKISADQRNDASELKTVKTGANEYAISPNGKLTAFVYRGEVFVSKADKEKSRAVNVSDSPYRDMNPAWLNDSVLVFVSDRFESNFELVAVKSDDPKESDLFKTLKRTIVRLTDSKEDESNPVVSNNGEKVAYMNGRGRFLVSEISSDLKLKKTIKFYDGWASVDQVTWSLDDKWLAFSMTNLEFNREVFIQATDNSSKAVNISMHPRSDYSPFWSADGSKLGFVSERNNLSEDIWFVWLKAEDFERSKTDWEEYEKPKETPAKKDDKKSKSSKKEEVKPIQIDFDGIYKRVVQVTSFSGSERDFVISKDGETFYYTAENTSEKGNDLYSIKWDGKKLTELTKGGSNPRGLRLDKEGKYVYFMKAGGSINRLDVKSSKTEILPYSGKMTIDFVAEKAQVFDEAWRTLRDGFYDPNFHGNNWEKLKTKYRDLAINTSIDVDFALVVNYMLGELNASHMRFTTPRRDETQEVRTGLLGTELEPTKGGVKVTHVVPNTPADKSVSKLMEGDIITSVDGVEIKENVNVYALLNGKVDEQVVLTVKGKDKKDREVVIRPVLSIRQELYNEWVENRRKLVEKWSNGKLGYIHVQGMNMPSFEVYERDFTAAGYGKEGMLIDVRYNGGGFTTDYLMTTLTYSQHSYTIPRGAAKDLEKEKSKFRGYYPIGERLVFAAWTKPSIALCNEGSYSNAEIFSHAYKSAEVGKLVGLPTNGSVISTGGRGLIDGSFVRLPFRAWFTKKTDLNQEVKGPAVPDIEVMNRPDWQLNDNDAQLKRAVEELLKEVN